MRAFTSVLKILAFLSLSVGVGFAATRDTNSPFAPPFPWLAEVSSTFIDEESNTPHPTWGVGFIARQGNRYFIISDSHLSQGRNSGIRLKGQTAAIAVEDQSRLADNETDLEVIEIPKPNPEIHPIFVLNDFRQSFELEDGYDLNPSTEKALVEVGGDAWAPIPGGLSGKPLPFRVGDHLNTPEPGGPVLDLNREVRGITFNLMLHDQVVDSRVVAGMSGAPLLFRSELTGKITIGGLAKSYHRHFDRSYFSYGSQISQIFQRYLYEGKRGHLTPARWHFRKGPGTYLDYGDGNVEINPGMLLSGGGEGGDVGGGESSDVDRTQSESGSNSHSSLGLRAGMIHEGTPALAFRVTKPGSFPVDVVYANRLGERYLSRLFSPEDVEAIRDESALIDLFRARIRRADLSQPGKTGAPSEECLLDEAALQTGRIRVKLSSRGESVLLELDSKGVLKGSSHQQFEPIVRIPLSAQAGKAPREVVVDLKGLFFADLSYAEQPTLGLVSDPLDPHMDLNRRSSYLSRCGKAPCLVVHWPEGNHDHPLQCRRSNATEHGCSPDASAPLVDLTGLGFDTGARSGL